MTVGLLINPGGIPAILTDTMAYSADTDNHSGLPTRYSPHTDEDKPIKRLFRKSFIINENIAFAVAGDVCHLSDFVPNLRFLVKNLGLEAGMNQLATMAHDFPSVQALISCAKVVDGKIESEAYILREDQRATAHHSLFGQVSAIGSGARRTLERTLLYAKQAERFDPLSKRPFELIASLNHSLTALKIKRETFYNEESDWGGFQEYIFFDEESGHWKREPRTLYLFFKVIRLKNKRYTTVLIRRSHAYEPGEKYGGILTKEGSKDGSAGFETLIEDCFDDDPARSFGTKIWYSWKPEIANVYFMLNDGAYGFRDCNLTTVDDEIKSVVYEIDFETTTYGLKNDLCDYYSAKAYAYTGWTYVPARDLDDSEFT